MLIFLIVEVDAWMNEANAQEEKEEEEEERNRCSSVMSHKSGSTEGEKVNTRNNSYTIN